ncbi:Pantothenate transporter liz1 [Colletotrichum sp. SAR 10_96]|nr:Pantothenate transporter liz1 [Colletotrichum sp. SAR 10_96]
MAPVSLLKDNVPSKSSELTTRIVPAIEEERKTTWRHFFWDAWDKTPDERRLIFKMDITLMTFGCLGTFIKYIDRLMETGWTICTLGQAFMRTPLQMYVMRFLLGLFETIVFSEAEIELARDRNPKEGRVKQGAFTWAQAKRCVTTPDIFILWLISVCNSVAHMPSDSMAFWFKAWNTIKPGSYTVPQINNYTTPLGGVTVILTLVFAWSSDTWLKGRRWPMLVVGGVVTGIVCILLATTPVFPQNKAFRWFLYYNTNWAFAANTMFWSWTQDTLPLFAFKTVEQPAVIGGNWGAAGMAFLYAIAALSLARIQYKRENKRLEAEVETSSTEHSG